MGDGMKALTENVYSFRPGIQAMLEAERKIAADLDNCGHTSRFVRLWEKMSCLERTERAIKGARMQTQKG